MLRILLVALLLAPNAVQALEPSDDTTQRLAALGRVWGVVKHAHPWLGYRDVDWDLAGIEAIERTLNAADDEAFAAATQEMLSALGDRATFVARQCVESSQPVQPRNPVVTANGALYLPPGVVVDEATVRTAADVIFDLRPQPGRCTTANLALFDSLARHLFEGEAATPAQRKVQHYGYKSQDPFDAEFDPYHSLFTTTPRVPRTGTATDPRSTVFVVGEHSMLPETAVAMLASGKASLISVGPWADLASASRTIALPGGYLARIRTGELLTPVAVRATVSAGAPEAAILAAATPARNGRRRSVGTRGTPAQDYRWRADDPYSTMAFPELPYRILGAYRYWNTIDLFYPYKNLIGDWEPRLAQMIAKYANAQNRREYELGIAESTTWVPDGHSYARVQAYIDLHGRAAPPFATMPVEGKVAVIRIVHESATAAGVRIGDELLAVGGRPVQERLDELRPYVSASHDLSLTATLARFAPWGAAGARTTYRFRRHDGSEYEATFDLATQHRVMPAPAVAWRILEGNVGYVDLEFLETRHVEQMMRDLRDTRAIVFDMRGYPRGTFVFLARRFNRTGETRVAQLRVPDVVGGEVGTIYDEQDFGPGTSPQYTSPTFMLIDERAISQSEHTALVLEAVSNTTFIGSPTAGANGNITQLVLPGGNFIVFTGLDVRHLDGRQLQRVGIIPHVPVQRTIEALSAGRDELLEKALELARE